MRWLSAAKDDAMAVRWRQATAACDHHYL